MIGIDALTFDLTHPLYITIVVILLLLWFAVHVGRKYNGADWGHPATNLLDGWIRLYVKKYQRQGDINIKLPHNTPLIIAANHISSIDPLLLVAATNRPIRFMIAKEEYERPILKWMFKATGCIPVDRGGRVEGAFRRAMRAINQGELVSIFPQGGIHCDETPRTRIKAGIIKLSALTGCAILPVRIKGISAPGTMVECILKRGKIDFDIAPTVTSEQAQTQNFRAAMSDWLVGASETLEL